MIARARLSRRDFLKLSAAGAAGWGLAPAWAGPARPRLAAALPVPFPHRFIPDPDSLLTRPPAGLDLLLVPAYVAAGLIQLGRLQRLEGPSGRAHDPDGAYTRPYRYALGAVLHPAGALLDDPWTPEAAWPAFGRLVLGAALMRRGYSPNDTHAGHLTEAAGEARAARRTITPDPWAALRAGEVAAAFAPVGVSPAGALETEAGLAASLPAWGGMLIEYDWVLPAEAPDSAAARAFLETLAVPEAPAWPAGTRRVPLAPLPDRAREQQARLWADLTRPRRPAGA